MPGDLSHLSARAPWPDAARRRTRTPPGRSLSRCKRQDFDHHKATRYPPNSRMSRELGALQHPSPATRGTTCGGRASRAPPECRVLRRESPTRFRRYRSADDAVPAAVPPAIAEFLHGPAMCLCRAPHLGIGIDRARVPHALQHGDVVGRVAVRVTRRQVDPFLYCEFAECLHLARPVHEAAASTPV